MPPEAKYAIIYNPSSAAGKSKAEITAAQEELNRLGVSYRLFQSEYPGHAIELAQQLSKEGYIVVAAGGDGTCNEILHGVISSGSGLPCGFIPMGSGNDIPAAIGICPNIKRACEILHEGNVGSADVGVALTDSGVKRYFLGIGSQGFDAEVTRRTNASKKSRKGRDNYVVNVLKTIIAWKNLGVRVIMDDQVYEGPSNCIAVGNGPSYGGGMYICHEARVHDKLFHISIINMNKFVLLKDFSKMYDASVSPHPKIHEYAAKKVRIEMLRPADPPYICQVDGEVLGEIPVSYELLPTEYPFIMPKCDEVAEAFKCKYHRDFHEHAR
jgi:diacylglycerol kinase (ATP)